jgi:hypothetical protein
MFKPQQRTLTLATGTTLDAFVIQDALYDIAGQVRQANNSPLAGVTLQLNGRAKQVTDAGGGFAFAHQQPGDYALKPISPQLTYLPAQRTLHAHDEAPQIFYALPLAVSVHLAPDGATTVVFTDTQGLPTLLALPPGDNEQVTITPLMETAPGGYLSTGHTFAISPSASAAGASAPFAGQASNAPAIVINIQYSQADLQEVMKAESLVLLQKSAKGWVKPQTNCAAADSAAGTAAVQEDLAAKKVTKKVCGWGTYGLFGSVAENRLYIPSVIKK